MNGSIVAPEGRPWPPVAATHYDPSFGVPTRMPAFHQASPAYAIEPRLAVLTDVRRCATLDVTPSPRLTGTKQ